MSGLARLRELVRQRRDFAAPGRSGDTRPLPDGPRARVAVSTLARRLAAIRRAHRAAGKPIPESEALQAIWAGIQRQHGQPPEKKRALVTEDLRAVVRKCPETLAGVRDRALLLLGFAGALRRSELAAIALPSQCKNNALAPSAVTLVFVRGGLELHIARSKGDQLGEGAIVGVPLGKTKLCPVAAVKAWLAASQVCDGPMFRSVDRHGRVGETGLSGGAIALIVKRRVRPRRARSRGVRRPLAAQRPDHQRRGQRRRAGRDHAPVAARQVRDDARLHPGRRPLQAQRRRQGRAVSEHADKVDELATRLQRLRQIRIDPEPFHVEINSIVKEMRRLSGRLRADPRRKEHVWRPDGHQARGDPAGGSAGVEARRR